MKAYLIDPKQQTITQVEHDASNYKNISRTIGCSYFTTVVLNEHDDTIYLDDEGLLYMDIKYMFQIDNNENFIVLNKSSVISVQGGTKSKKNLVDIFSKSEIFRGTKPYSVHRLDKYTSGVFVMAKNRETAQLLTSLFRLRKVHKTYLAICHGELEKNSGEWNNDLVRYDNGKKNY